MKRLQFKLRTFMIVSTAACLYIAGYFFLLTPSTVSTTETLDHTVSVRYWHEPHYRILSSMCSKVFAPIEMLDRQVRSDYWKGERVRYPRQSPDLNPWSPNSLIHRDREMRDDVY